MQIADQKRRIETLTEKFEQEVRRVEREFNERLNDFFADQEAQMRDAKEEVELSETSREEIVKAKENISRDKQKKDLSFNELIYGEKPERALNVSSFWLFLQRSLSFFLRFSSFSS